jgi:hypothetical protein
MTSTWRQVGNALYLRGNRNALISLLHFRGARASTLAGRWLSIGSSVNVGAIALHLSFGGAINDIETLFQTPLGFSPDAPPGLRGIESNYPTGGQNLRVVLWVDTSTWLPTKLELWWGNLRTTRTFSEWGQRFTVRAPSGAIPIR